MLKLKEEIVLLKYYFLKRTDVVMAFVFGSYAKGWEMTESDFDLAVYFRVKEKGPEQLGAFSESEVYSDISRIIKKEVDLVCLNDAPASLVSQVIKTGLPLVIKDRKLYWETYLRKSLEAEDFLYFLEGFSQIKQKAQSLNPEEKERLILRLDYLRDEFAELARF